MKQAEDNVKLRDVIAQINLPDLIRHHCGALKGGNLHRERGGSICDPIPGCKDKKPSFSVYKNDSGRWRFKRHNLDEGGDALDFLVLLGRSTREAIDEIYRFAGVPRDAKHWNAPRRTVPSNRPPKSLLDEAKDKVRKVHLLTEQETTDALRLLGVVRPDSRIAADLAARGIGDWLGLTTGVVRHAYPPLVVSGALGILISGPDGQYLGLKIRNPGTTEELAAKGLERYVYHPKLSGHGAPAWCSPNYGSGSALMIVEGELSGAAAARTFESSGIGVDVQGLAGAGGWPHLTGISGKPVYIYADDDVPGRSCVIRMRRLMTEAGATEVYVLPPTESGEDFCDLLGQLGPVEFAQWLTNRMDTAKTGVALAPTPGHESVPPPPQPPVDGGVVELPLESSDRASDPTTPGKRITLPVFNGLTAPPVQPVEWLIPKLLARGGGTILFGQPGASKSVHAACLVASLVAGKRFLDFGDVRPGIRVLYLDFDSSWSWNYELFMAAFRGMGIEGIPEAFHYYSPNTPECSFAGTEDALISLEALGPLIEAVVREQKIDLVICDSLGQMMVGDTNSGQEVALALRRGLNSARRAGAAVLVIDHAAKASLNGSGVPTPMGSQQKRAWARVSISISQEDKEGEKLVRWALDKTNTAPFEDFYTKISFVQDAGVGDASRLHSVSLTYRGLADPRKASSPKEVRTVTVQQEILSALQGGERARKELGAGGTYDRALAELERGGQIVKVRHGVYALADRVEMTPPSQPLRFDDVVRFDEVEND